jgi:hypothetical protein
MFNILTNNFGTYFGNNIINYIFLYLKYILFINIVILWNYIITNVRYKVRDRNRKNKVMNLGPK